MTLNDRFTRLTIAVMRYFDDPNEKRKTTILNLLDEITQELADKELDNGKD